MHESARPLVCVRPPGWTHAQAQPFKALMTWVQRAETLGFDGVFVGDRLLSEASRAGEVVYGATMLDAMVTLSAIAAGTEKVLLGPLVLVFPFRHPIQLAKSVASLDVVSGGRVVLGAGIGWSETEFSALGVARAGRGEMFEEGLAVVRRLWEGRPVDHHGKTWSFEGVVVSPSPVQRGGPPVWLASFSPGQALDWSGGSLPTAASRVLDRVGRLADGWVPLIYSASSKRRLDAETLAEAWTQVLAAAARAGRTREDIDFVFSDWCYVLDGPGSERRCREALRGFFNGTWDEALRTYTIGSRSEVLEKIRAHLKGIDRVDAYVLTPLADELEQLDHLAHVASELRPKPVG
ncbi:MAG: TIGR03619 family F420-dependent LLM class oxidoreductase [Actinomycetota bacterium]|nr:TIGR03619 family F420-dependent LLM class oxidoreductase [Actinomycetota bacterium]